MSDYYTPEERRAYMAAYRAKRRAWAYAALGGECVQCGSKEQLEFDHIDRTTKIHAVTHMLHRSKASFEAEVAKCQLLCKKHHLEKSVSEGSFSTSLPDPLRHGVLGTYDRRGCRCDPCKEVKRLSRKGKVQ